MDVYKDRINEMIKMGADSHTSDSKRPCLAL
jgi:hypothetical protein